jgi:hypothetical protein
LCTGLASAQESSRPAGPHVVAATFPRPDGEVLTAPAVVARATPRSFQIIEVTIPPAIASTQSIPYTVEPSGSTPVVSRRSGTIEPAKPGAPVGPRSLLVTFSIPKHAPAGMVEVARVRFFPPGGTPIEVPVNVLVDASEAIQLTVGEALHGVHAGERFLLTYRVTNLGNTPETVEVKAVLPAGWTLYATGAATRLGINGMIEQQMTIGVPLNAGTGASNLRLVAYANGAPVSTAEASVDVVDSKDNLANGPVVSTAMSFGWDPNGTMASGISVGVAGHLTDSISIQARFSSTPRVAGSSGYALSQAGFYQTPPMLQLTAPRLRLGLGLTGEQFSQLTGYSVNGNGISADVTRGKWQASMLVANPGYGQLPDSGILAGGRVEMNAGAVTYSGSATHLVDNQGSLHRSLDALSVGATLPQFLNGTAAAELAERWTAEGVAPGWTTSYARNTAGDNLSLRLLHAPGGTSAFAQAADQILASGGRSITHHLSVSGSYTMSQDDAGAGFGELTSHSWSAGPQLQVSRALGFSVSARQTAFAATGTNGSFSNGETGTDIGASFRTGAMYVTSFGSLVQASNATSMPDGGRLVQDGLRQTLNATAGVGGNHGTLELNTQLSRNNASLGQIPEQLDVTLRADRVPLIAAQHMRVFLSTSVRRSYTPGFITPRTYETAAIDAELPMGLSIGVSAQRNPFLLAGTTSGGWLYGLRVGRGTALPRVSSSETRGIVYKDLNDNGALDPGEPGVSGVVVRRGNESAITEADGSYRFLGMTRDSVTLDPSSLKVGMIAGSVRQHANRREIAVVAVSPVEIELDRSGSDLVQADTSALADIAVLARDDSGRVWVSRRSSAAVAVFDALPPGHYTVQIDLGDSQEKLETRAALPVFTVNGTTAAKRVKVALFARPVKVKNLDQPNAPPAPDGGVHQ